jgi:hypothetical protein
MKKRDSPQRHGDTEKRRETEEERVRRRGG